MKFLKELSDRFKMQTLGGNQGYVLLTTYILMAALSVTAMASMTRNFTYARDAERQKNAIVALQMAEGAVDLAVAQLAVSSSYTGVGYTDFSSGSARGGYSIAVTTPSGAASTIKQIAVTGYAPGNTATAIGYKTSSSNTYVSLAPARYFTRALFAKTSYTNNGNGTTDSYVSSAGAYSAATARSNGDVGTNSTAAGAVALSGNALVKGDVVVGAGGVIGTVITTTGNSSITGGRDPQTTNEVLSTPSTALASLGAMSLSGNSALSLAAGSYHYSSISITGNARLTTTGEVKIYVSGTVAIAGNGTASYQSLPKNLKIYSTGSSSVSISGNGNTYAAIYAPNSAVSISGNGTVYGSATGNTVTMNGNASFHYDEDLSAVTETGSGDPTVLTYIQTGNANWTV